MTTLRKKKEFKKSSKNQNNKTSKRKIRKRSKNKISKKRLLARNKLGGAIEGNGLSVWSKIYSLASQDIQKQKIASQDIEKQRNVSKTRVPTDIYDALKKIGQQFVDKYNKLFPNPQSHGTLSINNDGTRISPRDDSVYLEISILTSDGKKELFHISDHPGESKSDCGVLHIKQLHTFKGEPIGNLVPRNGKSVPTGRCLKIVPYPDILNKLTLDSLNSTVDIDFQILKSFIENISQDNVIGLGVYTRITPELIKKLQLLLKSEYSSPTKFITPHDPNNSMTTQPPSPVDEYELRHDKDNGDKYKSKKNLEEEFEAAYNRDFPLLSSK